MHKYENTYVPNFSLWNFLEIIECPARGLNGLIKSSYEILGTSLKKKKPRGYSHYIHWFGKSPRYILKEKSMTFRQS